MESEKRDRASARQNVLIVDDDLGFVFWLGELLAEAGYPAVPALNCQQAAEHIHQFQVTVSAVIVNPAVHGVSRLIRTLAGVNKDLKIILVPSAETATLPGLSAYATLEKPNGWELLSRQEWLRKIKKALADAPPFPFEAKAR